MIPAGYMAKRIVNRPDWHHANGVVDIYSVSSCVSSNFADYVRFWKHNGYWLFDSPEIIKQVARENAIDLSGTTLFYYEVHDLQFDDEQNQWKPFKPEESFKTDVVVPNEKCLAGWDVVTFYVGTNPECSPLSCNGLAEEIETNEHCLLSSFDDAHRLLETGQFKNSEPGPYRIFAVYKINWQ